MTFEYFGRGKHKIEMETLLTTKGAVFLDVRSREEQDSIQIKLQHHLRVLWIPIDEIPDRYREVPRDVPVGVFCSAGTRSTIVYFYLRVLGYENVRIAPSSYDALTSLLLPGKLHKVIAGSKMEETKG
jgi:rhodanese-related sulfurtransferase